MKKVLIITILLSCSFTLSAAANGPDVNFMASVPTVRCGQVEGLNNIADSYVIVFDYDETTAKRLGRPWKIVEEGKCYTGGSFLAIPTNIASNIDNVLSNPTSYDLYLDIVDYSNPRFRAMRIAMREGTCGLDKIVPDVCQELVDNALADMEVYGNVEINVGEILGPEVGSTEGFFYTSNVLSDEYLAVYMPEGYIDAPPEDRLPPQGLWANITAMENFKSQEIYSRFLSCDNRKREADVLFLKNNSADTEYRNFDDLIDHHETVWTMMDDQVINVTDYQDNIYRFYWNDLSDKEKELADYKHLYLFENMGCLNEVFEIRARVASIADSSIDEDDYIDDLKDKYIRFKSEESDLPKSTSTAQLVTDDIDDSVAHQQDDKENEQKMRILYFILFPIVGVVGLVIYTLLKRKPNLNV